MITDARQLPDGTAVKADVCIVGAGAAGITIARELISSGLTVIVFESGGFDRERAAQKLNAGRSNNPFDYRLDESRSRIFGGTTSQWSGWCRELDPGDFERRDWIPESGWPIGLDTLAPCYERARSLCEVTDEHSNPRSHSAGQKALNLEKPLITRRFELSPPTDFGRRYRDGLSSAANVSVYLNATATSFNTSETSERVDSIEFKTLSATSIVAKAGTFVLASGGIENARLLLASADNRRYALGNSTDLVGRYYMDHFAFFSSIIEADDTSPSLEYYTRPFDGRPARGGRVTGGITLDDAELRQRKLLGAVLRFVERPAFTLTRAYNSPGMSSALRIVNSVSAGKLPPDISAHFARATKGVAKVAAVAARRFAHDLRPHTKLSVRCLAETAPNRDNRITLSNSRDALGQRHPAVVWNIGESERRSVSALHSEFLAQASKLDLGPVQPIDEDFEPKWLTGASHHMGTTRMHDSPRHGVVDRNCRVHGIGNLYVAGSSVFPTCGYANPTLTIVALAIRLADRLKGAVQR